MKKLSPSCSVLIIFLYFLSFSRPLYAQIPQFPIKEWTERLIHDKIYYHDATYAIVNSLSAYKSTIFEKVMSQLENEGRGEGSLFQLRLIQLRAGYIRETGLVGGYEKIKLLLDSAMKIAYETGDNNLIAFASRYAGKCMYYYNDIVLAVTYSLKAVELLGGLNLPKEKIALDYAYLGEMFFHTKEYRQSIFYTQTGLRDLNTTDKEFFGPIFINTIGQCYQQLGMRDSALYYFKLSYNMVRPGKNILWKGINSLYMGQINFTKGNFTLAKQQLSFAYEANKNEEHSIAASALEWLAKLMMLQKKNDSACIYLSQSIGLLNQDEGKPHLSLQVANFLCNVYFTKAEFHHVMNQPDSMNYYFSKYAFLQDSLQTVTINGNSKITQQRIDNEKKQFAIQALQKEKRIVKITRNFIIVGISLLAIVIILILNRQKRELKYREEVALFQQKALESEKELNLRQLELFTHNLLEKSMLVESLQQQIIEKSINQEHQQIIDELSGRTILTEEDWTRFKTLFEKIYPGFFIKLKEKFPDITLAEQRMASLIRLRLTTRQIAPILGISVGSVHKSRQRLRQRLQVGADTNLDELVTNF